MDLIISYCSDRETPWTGHTSNFGVRRTIKFAALRGRELTIFRQGYDANGIVFIEIPRDQWDEAFAD